MLCLSYGRETSEIQESLKKFKSSPGGITILDDTGEGKEVKRTFSIIKPLKSDAQIRDSIRIRINSKLSSSELSFSAIEDIICFKQDNIFVDEYCTSLKEGLLHASKLKYTITGHKDYKETNYGKLGLLTTKNYINNFKEVRIT